MTKRQHRGRPRRPKKPLSDRPQSISSERPSASRSSWQEPVTPSMAPWWRMSMSAALVSHCPISIRRPGQDEVLIRCPDRNDGGAGNVVRPGFESTVTERETDSGTHRWTIGRSRTASTTVVTFRGPSASPSQRAFRACTAGRSVARGNGDGQSTQP